MTSPSVISFTVPGEGRPQQRAGAHIINGHVAIFEKNKSREYKAFVKMCAKEVAPEKPLEGALSLAVKVYRQVPKSWSKKNKEAALAGSLRPTTRPDLKNIIWGIEDALNGIMWSDDSQIIDFDGSGKWYAETPRVEITIRCLAAAPAIPTNQMLLTEVGQ